MKASENAALQIRKILDGKGTAATRRYLVALGAVDEVLSAVAGDHGPPAPGQTEKSVDDFTKTLVAMAEADPATLAEAMAHHQPALNLVVWALGHSKSRHAQQVLKDLVDHEDPAIGHMAEHHLERHKRARARPRRPRRG